MLFFLATPGFAEYAGRCVDRDSRWILCDIVFNADTILFLGLDDPDSPYVQHSTYHRFSIEIPWRNVLGITTGDPARRRVEDLGLEGTVYKPAILKHVGKKRDLFAIEYLGESGKQILYLFQVKKKDGVKIQEELNRVRGLRIGEPASPDTGDSR
jgi:hypothetical protein